MVRVEPNPVTNIPEGWSVALNRAYYYGKLINVKCRLLKTDKTLITSVKDLYMGVLNISCFGGNSYMSEASAMQGSYVDNILIGYILSDGSIRWDYTLKPCNVFALDIWMVQS